MGEFLCSSARVERACLSIVQVDGYGERGECGGGGGGMKGRGCCYW